MTFLVRKLLFATGALIVCQPIYASVPNDNSHPVSFLGPTGRVGLTSLITDNSAYSFAGEAGLRNLRIGGTVGFNLISHHQLKFSAEYLWQKLDFAFFDGDKGKWVTQGAVGANYQYALTQIERWRPMLGLSAYYSNAPATAMGTDVGTFVNSSGTTQSFSNTQRISDSNATGFGPGVTVQPWQGGKVGLALNYDNVRYGMKYESNRTAKGMGGTAHIDQALTNNMAMGVTAAVRQPFNYYEAEVGWNRVPYFGPWALKLVGAYTIGKNTLPSSYNAGLTADYFLDGACNNTAADQAANDFLAWIAKPAVYMPQVLSVADESITIS